jgi:cytidylate kinase
MIKVITVEREYGSGGGAVARRLAERLGWKLWDQLLTDELAKLLKCGHADVQQREERRDPLYYRLLKSFMRGTFEGNLNAPALRLLDADRIFATTCRLIHQAAEAGGAVIVGRGGAYCLRERSDAYHVFTYASDEEKVRRLREDGIGAEEAKDLVAGVDKERAAAIEKYFGLQWPTLSRYHLMINTSIGEAAVVETIVKGIAVFERRYSARRH